MKKVFLTTFINAVLLLAVSAQYDAKKFGASGNGITLDTRFIQDAVDSASANGGGIVYFPSGVYKIGTIVLRSNIALKLSPGAVIIGSDNVNDYTAVHQKYESRTRNLYAKYCMFFAEEETNISITGSGKIDGNGLKHFQNERPQNARPFMIRLVNCSRIVLKDVHLVESANWSLHLLACSNVNIDGLSVITTAEGNRDGIDIDACRNVSIENCYVSTTDDAIVMKSTSDEVCSDITITNCVLRSKGSAIKTGTESNGGFKNITISNCAIREIPVHAGIELMTVDGGILQNILIQNISMENVATPFFIRIGARARPYKSGQYVQRIEKASNISLSNIMVTNAKLPSSIIGLANRKLANISVSGYTVGYVESQRGAAYNKVPSLEFDYPAANMFSNLPAFGIYCRDVSGLVLENIKLTPSGKEERRPAFVFDRIENLQLKTAETGFKNGKVPVAYFRNVKDAVVSFCGAVNGKGSLFAVEEYSKEKMQFVANTLRKGQTLVANVEALTEPENLDRYDVRDVVSKTMTGGNSGLQPYKLENGAVTIPVVMKKGGAQLCLLVLNEKTGSNKIRISYDHIVQEFEVDWQQWGWAPVSLLREFSENEKVTFKVEAAEKGSSIRLGKYFMRSQDNGYTD